MSSRAIRALAVVLLAGAACGQTVPATGEAKMVLDFRDVPADTMLQEVAVKLNLVILKRAAIPDKVTVLSGKAVGVKEAVGLINDGLWPMGYRMQWDVDSQTDPRYLRIVKRPTVANPAEMRVWKKVQGPVVSVPAEMPGVSTTATMKMRFANVRMSTVLEEMGRTFGFVADPADLAERRVTVTAPVALHAGEAAGLVSEMLVPGGHMLRVETVEDAKGEMRSLLHVVSARVTVPVPETVNFGFDDAPLGAVMDELAKRSGFAVVNTLDAARVTIHDTLKLDAIGTDVGPLVARLNEKLEGQGVIIQETSREAANGKKERVLAAMSIAAARKTVLAGPVEFEPEPAWERVGVDMKATMQFRYDNAMVETVLDDMAQRFGYLVMMEDAIPFRITTQVRQPSNAQDAVHLLNDCLVLMGFAAVELPATTVKGTILRVMPLADAKRHGKTGLFFDPLVAAPGSNPSTTRAASQPESMDDLIERMRARRAAETRRAATMPGGG
jgi:hypothetical protein